MCSTCTALPRNDVAPANDVVVTAAAAALPSPPSAASFFVNRTRLSSYAAPSAGASSAGVDAVR